MMLWDLENDKQILKFEAHSDLFTVEFSRDGQTLATGGWDGALKLWHVKHNRERTFLSEPTILNFDKNMTYDNLAFSPNGKLLATNGGKTVPIWDVVERRLVSQLVGHTGDALCVAFSTDGTLATGGTHKSIRLWNVTTGQQIAEFGVAELDRHEGSVNSVAFSPDGFKLASGSSDNTVKVWDVATGALQATLRGHANAVTRVAFSPDGATLASASADGAVKLWNTQQPKESPTTLRGHAGHVLDLAFSPNGKVLASAGGGSADEEVRLWDLNLPSQRETFDGLQVPFHSRGDALTSWTSEGIPQLCDNSTDQESHELASPDACSVVHSPDGSYFATGNTDGAVEIHFRKSGEKQVLPGKHGGPVVHVLFSPDGKTLVSQGGPPRMHVLMIRNAATACVLASMDVSRYAYPVFSPDSKVLATVIENRRTNVYSIKLWSSTGEELATIIDQPDIPFFSLAFSAGGEMLAAGSVFGEITVWDVSSGEELLKSFKAHTSNVFCLAFSPNSKRLASCSDDRTVKLWDLPTGDHMITLIGHRHSVWSVGFSPDGHTLASASAGGVVNLSTAATKEEVGAVDW